jgi:two-component system NtrC family sensor kinase
MAFNSLVENLRIGKTGFAFIVNRQGAFQTKPRFDAIPDRAAFNYFNNDKNLGTDTVHIVERTDSIGNRNIYAAAFLKNGEWLMICQQSWEDAFSDLEHTWKIALAGLMVGGFAIIVTAFVLAKRTIHKLAQSDHEKEMMNQQVIETGRLASIGELAAGIAHEINNPVAIMVEEAGWVQDLLEDEEFQESNNLEELHRSLQQIKTQGRRCKEITHKLLSFARKTDSTVQKVSLNGLIEEVVGVSVQRAKYSNVFICTHFNEQVPIVQASRTEMQQVFLNLINNALDAMDPKGGTVDITTRVDGNTVEIDVADNGPGIPDSYLPKIFDPFFTTKPVGKGTGLGLSICYGIIKKLGGDVTVESVVEKGTTFHIRMPMAALGSDRASSNRAEHAA